jgi:GH25 family lysozyme M1 (1,4-beta-N-acetylmuramidase)
MPKQVDAVIRVAEDEVGVREGRSGDHWNNHQKYSLQVPQLEWSDGQPWCQTFVTWVARKTDVQALYHPVASPTASCDAAGAWFKKIGRWSEYPAVGAQVFLGTSRDLNHTGLVVQYDDTFIYTVEGNTNTTGAREGNGVYAKKRGRRDIAVVGYGYPAFAEGIQSADPQWAPGVETPAGGETRLISGGGRIDGVDLSHHNTGVTLTALKEAKAAGVRFISHKATEGHGFTDSQYRARRRLAARAGIQFGAYHYARPDASTGREQARRFLAVATPEQGDLLPMLDLEDQGGLPRARLTAWVAEFVAEVTEQTGAEPIIYTPFDLDDSHSCRLWVARYNDDMRAPRVPRPWKDWDVWQFSNGQSGRPDSVPGLGRVDLNTLSSEPARMVKRLRIRAPKTRKPAVAAEVGAQSMSFVDVSANVQGTDPATETSAYIANIAANADLIGWQEVGDPEEIAALRRLSAFQHYLPGGAANAVAISWRADLFDVVGCESIKVHGGQPGVTPARYINAVRLSHRVTGREVARINTHVVHHIESGGRARSYQGAEAEKFADQLARAVKHFTVLRDTIVTLSQAGPVVFGGDLNVAYNAERKLARDQRTPWFPLTLLSPVIAFDMPENGTRGKRQIDWSGHTSGLICSDVGVLPSGTSDHRAIRKTYRLAAELTHG